MINGGIRKGRPLTLCSCGHFFHDIEDYDDPQPTCCTIGCPCGKTAEQVAREFEVAKELETLR